MATLFDARRAIPFPHLSHLSVLCPNRASGGSRRKLPLMRQLRGLAFCCLCPKAYFVLSLGVRVLLDTRPFGVLVNPTFCQIRPTFCQVCVAWSRAVPTETPTFWPPAPPIATPPRPARRPALPRSARCAYRSAYLSASCAASPHLALPASLGKQNFNLHVVTGGRAVP